MSLQVFNSNVEGDAFYLKGSTWILNAYPFTVSCWYRAVDTVTSGHCCVCLAGEALNTNTIRMKAGNGLASLQVNTDTVSTPAIGVVRGAWCHIAGVGASATSRSAYIQGGNKTTSVVNVTCTSTAVARIGSSGNTNTGAHGFVAEIAVWNTALDDTQIADLARGRNPQMFSLPNLIFYAPLKSTRRNSMNRPAIINRPASGSTITFVPTGGEIFISPEHPPVQDLQTSRKSYFMPDLKAYYRQNFFPLIMES